MVPEAGRLFFTSTIKKVAQTTALVCTTNVSMFNFPFKFIFCFDQKH